MAAVQRGVQGHAVGAHAYRFHVHSTPAAETGTTFDREHGRTGGDLQQRRGIRIGGDGMHCDLGAFQRTTGTLFYQREHILAGHITGETPTPTSAVR